MNLINIDNKLLFQVFQLTDDSPFCELCHCFSPSVDSYIIVSCGNCGRYHNEVHSMSIGNLNGELYMGIVDHHEKHIHRCQDKQSPLI